MVKKKKLSTIICVCVNNNSSYSKNPNPTCFRLLVIFLSMLKLNVQYFVRLILGCVVVAGKPEGYSHLIPPIAPVYEHSFVHIHVRTFSFLKDEMIHSDQAAHFC